MNKLIEINAVLAMADRCATKQELIEWLAGHEGEPSTGFDVRQWLCEERLMYAPGTPGRAKCDEAFAAVVELIAADEEYNRAREAWMASPGKHGEFQATRDAAKRRTLAFARVKGESA